MQLPASGGNPGMPSMLESLLANRSLPANKDFGFHVEQLQAGAVVQVVINNHDTGWWARGVASTTQGAGLRAQHSAPGGSRLAPVLVKRMKSIPVTPGLFVACHGSSAARSKPALPGPHAGEHPLHLHGHWFWVEGRGRRNVGDFDPARDKLKRWPLLRDTATVPAGSWMVLRFVATNPGVW